MLCMPFLVLLALRDLRVKWQGRAVIIPFEDTDMQWGPLTVR